MSAAPGESSTHRAILQRAWPIILANATVPLLGLVDTAVIGHTGSAVDLGAIALGSLVFNFLYFGFNFLRMSTTGFIAQAVGARDEAEALSVLLRGIAVAALIGLGLVALKRPLELGALQLLHGSPEVERIAREYVSIRLWAAPATLCTHVARGALIGLGYSRQLLLLETSLNAANLGLNLILVGVLRWGARGVATGTALAEWFGAGLALWIVYTRLRERAGPELRALVSIERLRDPGQLRKLFSANADILLRTLCLLFGFAYFTDRSARFGDGVLAANHVLLQFLSFSAFFLDGYANVAESLVGAAIGSSRRQQLDRAVWRSSELAGVSAALLALSLFALGPYAIAALTDLPAVQHAAREQLPMAALYIAVSFVAFQLDGVFIGATRTRDMRNASLASAGAFVAAAWLLTDRYGNRGLWWAFILFVIARALALACFYPGLRRAVPGDDG